MIKKLLVFSSVVVLLSSCVKSKDTGCQYKESTVVAPASEQATLQTYVNANDPAAILHPSGFYYKITAPSTGSVTPGVCSSVTVRYSGYLTNGTKFDENLSGINFVLGGLIIGWQKGIPLIKKGGTITLYLPPSLGYGSNAVGSIPANSILIFYIQLLDVQ
ncbi:FKBP-type peptidyl-prolyl cis-trans isomerase [Ferruginibacter sp. SUN106]|uniref:FKBP-type peptidyl-prolyl cis-trans isomerase n=1 Tax=Ferruginibacter sp. SUN106 TaxID=2978348 RepID=UPI003D360085